MGVYGHISFAVAIILNDGAAVAETVISILFETAVVMGLHELRFVIMHDTKSPFAIAFVTKEALFEPVLIPFILHWNAGVKPPFIGIAVNVTVVAVQIVVEEAVIITDGITCVFTMICKLFDKAVGVVTQG